MNKIVFLFVALLLVSSCSQQKREVKTGPPELKAVDFKLETRDKSETVAKSGKTIFLKGTIENNGGAIKGFNVELSGSLLKKGILETPKSDKAKVILKKSATDLMPSSESMIFTRKNENSIIALMPDIKCSDEKLQISIAMEVLGPGKGKIKIVTYPDNAKEKNEIKKSFKLTAYGRPKKKRGPLINNDFEDPQKNLKKMINSANDHYGK